MCWLTRGRLDKTSSWQPDIPSTSYPVHHLIFLIFSWKVPAFLPSHQASWLCTVGRKTVYCQMSRFSASTPFLGLLSQTADVSEREERKYSSSVFHLGGNYDFGITRTHSQDIQYQCDEIQNLLSSSRQSETRKSFSRSSTVETCETILRFFLNFLLRKVV